MASPTSFDDFKKGMITRENLDKSLPNPDFSITVPFMGHYLDAIFATKETVERRKFEKETVELFNPPRYTAGEHRALYGIFKIYAKRGLNLQTFTDGIFTTIYELCEAMEYERDKCGKFGKWNRKEAIKNVISLGKKTVDIYKRQFTGLNKEKRRTFNVWVFKDKKILEFEYVAEKVTKEEVKKETKVRKKAKILWIQLNPILFNKEYFKLAMSDFYTELKNLLSKENRKITEYHWLFMLWLLKQNNPKNQINVDKLVEILKIYTENRNLPRARKFVRNLYNDFKKINYLLDYQIDINAKNGEKKDVLISNPEKFLSLKKKLEKQKEKAIGYSKN